jgi:hypothetical protein
MAKDSKSKKTNGKAKKPTDAIMLLKADHRTVLDLFEQFESAKGDDKKLAIAQQICTELKVHAQIEEEIFYPAFRGRIEDDLLDEAYVEHDGAKVLINDVIKGLTGCACLSAKVTVLGEDIRHHIKEEEQGKKGMFAQCRETEVDLVELRDRMMARKEELMAQAAADGLPPAQLTALDLQPSAAG